MNPILEEIEKFLSYYPLKQGLKRERSLPHPAHPAQFLSYYPLKQGLKPKHLQVIQFRQKDFYPTIH